MTDADEEQSSTWSVARTVYGVDVTEVTVLYWGFVVTQLLLFQVVEVDALIVIPISFAVELNNPDVVFVEK